MDPTSPRRTVLLVEDNATMRAFIRSLIENDLCVVHECADAETAIHRYQQLRPDWVLMDIKLSGKSGIVATHEIRLADPTAQILIVTEQSEAHYRRDAEAAGAVAFLHKEDLLELPGILAELEGERLIGRTLR